MKTICLATIALFLMNAGRAHAGLYLTGDPHFGPNSVVVDTSTGLGWLNLSEADGLSYQQVTSEMQPGGTFSGFQYATVQQVLGLYSSAGIPGIGYYSLSTPAIPSLFSLIGTSGTSHGYSGVVAISGTPFAGGYCAPAIYVIGTGSGLEYWVSAGDQSGGSTFGSTFSYPDLSSWLVKEVPEPASAQLLIPIVVSWCGFKFLRPRKTAR